MNRRHLIGLSCLSLAGFMLPFAGVGVVRASSLFRDMFGDDSHAMRIGKLSYRLDPKAGGRGRSLLVGLASLKPSKRTDQLEKHRQADFAALDIVTVDGWVMARSEADLCAAVYQDRGLA